MAAVQIILFGNSGSAIGSVLRLIGLPKGYAFCGMCNIKVDYVTSNSQLLHCKFYDLQTNREFFVSVIYRETRARNRTILWEFLKCLASNMDIPWLVLGDFNSYLDPSDKEGGAPSIMKTIQHFVDCIMSTGLLNPPFKGNHFTWEWHDVRERLDWVFHNIYWETLFPITKVFHDLKFSSNHSHLGQLKC